MESNIKPETKINVLKDQHYTGIIDIVRIRIGSKEVNRKFFRCKISIDTLHFIFS